MDRSAPLLEKTLTGELDVVLVWGDGSETPHGERVAAVPIQWIGRPGWPGVEALAGEPLPFIAFGLPCTFRSAAVEAMDAAGLSWRLVFTSPSLSGLWAAVEGGLGITARTVIKMPESLVALDPVASGLPALPHAPLALHRAEADPSDAVTRLIDILSETIRDELAAVAAY